MGKKRRIFRVDDAKLKLDVSGEGVVEEKLPKRANSDDEEDDENDELLLALQLSGFHGSLSVKRAKNHKSSSSSSSSEIGNTDTSPAENGHGLEVSVFKSTEKASENEKQSSTSEKKNMFTPISDSLKGKLKNLGNASASSSPEKQQPSSASNNWTRTLNALRFAQHVMPDPVRQKRASSRRQAMQDEHGQMIPGKTVPTKLHLLCSAKDATFEALHAQLLQQPEAAGIQDTQGRLPLHVLGDNDTLVSSAAGKNAATKFASLLIVANPHAITTADAMGFFPFVSLIYDWFLWFYETSFASRNKTEKKNAVARLVGAVVDSSALSGITAESERNAQEATTPDPTVHSQNLEQSIVNTFPEIEMWDEVEWCFDMLSCIMDDLGGKNGGLHKSNSRRHPNKQDKKARTAIANHIVEHMPTILKSILLIEDEGGETRRRLLGTSIVRRILLCPQSVGPWVTRMLRRKGVPAQRAIDYLTLASDTTPEDYAGSYRALLPEDRVSFQTKRHRVFAAVDELNGTIASLVVLPLPDADRATSAQVVWFVMTKNLERPFVVSLVLIDFVLHVTLMIAFRNAISMKVYSTAQYSAFGVVPSSVVYVICGHYLLRKLCEGLSLLLLSRTVLFGYLSNVWTLLDLLAIVLTVVTASLPSSQGLNAFVLGLLWLKILSFMKTTNKDMSLFISALFQILKSLRFFLVVMLVFIMMFADMMWVAIATKDDGHFCDDLEEAGELEGPVADFCNPNRTWSYLRMYSMLIGDFELDDYTKTNGMITLFVLFSLLGVIILLNMLIALVSDQYQDAKVISLHLFGRSRMLFVAQNQALESLLRPGTNLVEGWAGPNVSARSVITSFVGKSLRLIVLLSLAGSAFITLIYLVWRTIEVIGSPQVSFLTLVFMFVIAVGLGFALWVLLLFSIGNAVFPASCFNGLTNGTDRLVKGVAYRLFGLDRDQTELAAKTTKDVNSTSSGSVHHQQEEHSHGSSERSSPLL